MLTVGEILALYLASLQGRPSHSIVRRAFRQHFAGWAALPADQLTKEMVLLWRSRGYATPANITKALKCLRSAYRLAVTVGRYQGDNPGEGIRGYPPRRRQRRIQPWEWSQVQAVLADGAPRWEAYILMLYLMDCRPSEARRIRKDQDLDLTAGIWRKPDTKTGGIHEVPLPAQLIPKLQALPPLRDGLLFPWHETTVRLKFAATRRRTGIVGLQLRDFRRSGASDMTDAGVPLSVVQRILDHKSLASTQHYIVPSMSPQREAIQAHANRVMGGQLPLAI